MLRVKRHRIVQCVTFMYTRVAMPQQQLGFAIHLLLPWTCLERPNHDNTNGCVNVLVEIVHIIICVGTTGFDWGRADRTLCDYCGTFFRCHCSAIELKSFELIAFTPVFETSHISLIVEYLVFSLGVISASYSIFCRQSCGSIARNIHSSSSVYVKFVDLRPRTAGSRSESPAQWWLRRCPALRCACVFCT